MTLTRTRAPLVVLLLAVSTATMLVAKDRIFVDQWSPTRSELFIADADGSNARKLVAGLELDYNASFSSDGEWVVFTSERHGSADIFRVRANGMGLERLTDSPAFDDQAALSPDGNSLAFVSTRDTGSTDIHVLDLKTRQTRNLTNSPGGDYRPSWSPDGRRLAFSSDRGTKLQRSKGNWEQVQASKRLRRQRGWPRSAQTLVGWPARRIAEVVAGRRPRGFLRARRGRHLQGTGARRAGDRRVADRFGRCRDRRPRRARVGSRAEAVAAVPRCESDRLPGQVRDDRGVDLQLG